MHRLCSIARVTYSEFGLTFDSKITARYAAHVAVLESRGHPPSRALSHAPPPRSTAPAERQLSLIHHCAPHTTPYLTRCYSQAALLLRFQRRRRGLDKHASHACLTVHQTEYSLRATMWRDPSSSYFNS